MRTSTGEQNRAVGEEEDVLALDDAAIVVAGEDGIVSWASSAVRDLLGHDPDGLVGRSIEVLVPAAYVKRHRAGWRRTWQQRRLLRAESPIMIPVVCGDGEVRRFASHLVPLEAPHGQLLAVAAVWVPPTAADASARQLT
jgi:PAS domain S-box-containing protein